MLLSPESPATLSANFFNVDTDAYDTDTTLQVTTAVYNKGDYKAGNPPVATISWVFTPASVVGLFTCKLPASAIGPGPNSPGNVFPLTLVTTGISAIDHVTPRFKDTAQVFNKPSPT